MLFATLRLLFVSRFPVTDNPENTFNAPFTFIIFALIAPEQSTFPDTTRRFPDVVPETVRVFVLIPFCAVINPLDVI